MFHAGWSEGAGFVGGVMVRVPVVNASAGDIGVISRIVDLA
ncbi:hypothetical protein N806_30100 [Rhodococcus sp. P27]|nr:hypothetical protein N806_30100 [Rhodococcus sp. P27]